MFDVISTIGSSIQPIYAASSARINPDDMLTAPNGAHYETNLKLRAEDLEFIRALQEMGNKKCKKIEKSTCIFKKSMIRYYSCQR